MVVFARNARKWNHAEGGQLHSFQEGGILVNPSGTNFFKLGGVMDARAGLGAWLRALLGIGNRKNSEGRRFERIRNNDSPTAELSERNENEVNDRIRNLNSAHPADGYFIPYDMDKEVIIDNNRVSTNMLDSLGKYALLTKVPVAEAIASADQETKFGAAPNYRMRTHKKGETEAEKRQVNESNRALLNMSYARNFGGIPAASLINDHEWYTQGYSGTATARKYGLDTLKSPLQHGLTLYKAGLYNPGDKGHTKRVRDLAEKIKKNPAYQNWYNEFKSKQSGQKNGR